jgi:leader peptidase (prepilin peptidase)/N-methyltransferase
MLLHLVEISSFIFGMCIGSFLNVCIYRVPTAKSIIDPRRSICPSCGNNIAFYDNIPVLSYLILKRRCRHCKAPISLRYPLVEIASGFFALCIFLRYGLTFEALIYYAFIASLLVITFIDIDHQIIPDIITLPGIPLCFLASFLLPAMTYKDAIFGLFLGGGSLFIVAWVYHLIRKKEGMGGGDIKLLAMIGALIGWKGVLFTIFFASALGTLSGILLMLNEKKGMKLAIPFGPFLSLGAISYIFFGRLIIRWYLNLSGWSGIP